MHGQQQVMAHVSMGSKQPKNAADHGTDPVGFVMPEWSFAVALMRFIQSPTSCSISDLGAAAAILVGER